MTENFFVINSKLPSLNEYISACRSSKYAGAKFKEETERLIYCSILNARNKKTLRPIKSFPVVLQIEWNESTKRRDVDNIQSAQKYILDTMQTAKIIPNDSRRYVQQIYHDIVDADKDGVKVTIIEQ